jgi:hypothetical protein
MLANARRAKDDNIMSTGPVNQACGRLSSSAGTGPGFQINHSFWNVFEWLALKTESCLSEKHHVAQRPWLGSQGHLRLKNVLCIFVMERYSLL